MTSTTLNPSSIPSPVESPFRNGAIAKAPTGNPTLGATVREFYRHPSPILLSTGLLVTLLVRLFLGSWTIWDVVIPVAFFAWQPLQEWLIHKYILHFRPRKIGKYTIDFSLAQTHRNHHIDPWNTPTLFVPLWAIAASGIIHTLAFFTLMPTIALAVTGMTTMFAVGCYYEWSHYLPHTAYRPKLKFWKDMVKYHRLHHFKNEHYWMGVSSNLGDKLLKTFPESRDVETSDTARNLLGGETRLPTNALTE